MTALKDSYNIMIIAAVLYGILALLSAAVFIRSLVLSMRLISILALFLLISSLSYIISRIYFYEALKFLYGPGCDSTCDVYFKVAAVFDVFYFISFNLLHWIYSFKFWVLANKMEIAHDG